VAWWGASGADKHPNAIACQVISGKVISACHIIALSNQPPNRRLQRTAPRAREIGAFLKVGFGSTAFSISNAPPLKRKTLGGIQLRRRLVHEMQLMVMHSNV
jgi:hypothetical protein